MATFSVPRSASGNKPVGYEPAYGGIPNLPQYTTDTNTTVGTDVQANILKNLPGYMGMVGKDTANITSNLAGSLSPDVIQQLQQQAAERGIMTGAPGSPNTDAAYLRALGLTSLQLQQLGHGQLTEAIQRTPIQQTQTTTQTHDLGAERAIYAAAPVPGEAARQALLNAQMGMGQGARYASGYGGGSYGGGYGQVSGGTPLKSTPWTDYGTGVGGGRTGYFEESPGTLPSTLNWSTSDVGWQPRNTYYDPNTDTSNFSYGLPRYYNTEATPEIPEDPNAWMDYLP